MFAEFARFTRDYGELSVLPTPAFFHGLKPSEEISVTIEEGKTLFIRLINVGALDAEGRRAVLFELNGVSRQTTVADRSGCVQRQATRQGRPRHPHAASRRTHSRPDYRLVRRRRHQGRQRR